MFRSRKGLDDHFYANGDHHSACSTFTTKTTVIFFQKWFKRFFFTQYSFYSRLQLYKCIDLYFCNFDLYSWFYTAFGGSNIFSIKLFGNRFKYLKSIDLFIASDNEFLISFHNSVINFFKRIRTNLVSYIIDFVKTMEFIQNSCTVPNKICRYFGG